MTHVTTHATTLAGIREALQDVSNSVRVDSLEGYRVNVRYALMLGCTEEQIRDAYSWGARLRLKYVSARPVSFLATGVLR